MIKGNLVACIHLVSRTALYERPYTLGVVEFHSRSYARQWHSVHLGMPWPTVKVHSPVASGVFVFPSPEDTGEIPGGSRSTFMKLASGL